MAKATSLVEFVDPAGVSDAHRDVWQNLHSAHTGHETVFAGQAFFDALVETQTAEGLMLAVDPAALTLAVLRLRKQLLDPHGLAGYVLRRNLRMWALSGSEPLLKENATVESVAAFLCALDDVPGSHDAFELQSVEVGSLPWRAATESEAVRKTFFVYMPNGVRACHLTPLPESIEAYLAQFPRKKRYNLQRQLRQIAENLGGPAEVVPIDTEARVDELIAAVRDIDGDEAPLLSKAEYLALARKGLLLNFVVRAGGHPVAVILGIPSGKTYRIHKVMYAQRLSPYSPGTSTLHLMNEWFIADGRFRRLDFGFGEPGRTYSSSNTTVQRARVLLVRKTLRNRCLLAAHRAVLGFERFARKRLKQIRQRAEARKAAAKAEPEAPKSES